MNTIRQLGLALVAGGALCLAVPQTANAQATYIFTNFDGPGDHTNGTTINGISSGGTEVGFSANAGGATFTNFLRNPDGTFVTLSALPGAAQANGVNNGGTVVGSDGAGNAFSLTGGALTTLPNADPGNTTSQLAFGINNAGKIVGQYVNTTTGNTPGFLYANPNFMLFTPATVPVTTVTNVQSINNNGLAVGFYSPNGVNQHGFAWDTNTNAVTLFADPSTARIAADGLVLTQFLGINGKNEAVGYYQTNNGSQFGFTYDVNTQTYTFLDDPLAAPVGGVQITQITGVDNKGDLSGFFIDGAGVQHGFFAAAVPEPGVYALLAGFGVTGLALVLKKRGRQGSEPLLSGLRGHCP